MGAVRLLCLALLTVSQVTGGRLDGEGRVLHTSSFLRRQLAIAICNVQGRTGIGEDGGSVAPVEHYVEEETEGRRACAYTTGQSTASHPCVAPGPSLVGMRRTCPAVLGCVEANAYFDPGSP